MQLSAQAPQLQPAAFHQATGPLAPLPRRLLQSPSSAADRIGGTTLQLSAEGRHRALQVGGELWVVGNRHLAHHAKLQRIFRNCEVVGSSPKFVVLRAIRR